MIYIMPGYEKVDFLSFLTSFEMVSEEPARSMGAKSAQNGI